MPAAVFTSGCLLAQGGEAQCQKYRLQRMGSAHKTIGVRRGTGRLSRLQVNRKLRCAGGLVVREEISVPPKVFGHQV